MTVDQPADQPLPDPEPVAVPVPEPGRRPGRLARLRSRAEAGMSTAEYAVGTVAACAFAAVLYRVVSGDSVVAGLTELVDAALATLS
ncbi:DUF4244 domain-containing protein [Blastococcus sp. SYSU DS0510]